MGSNRETFIFWWCTKNYFAFWGTNNIFAEYPVGKSDSYECVQLVKLRQGHLRKKNKKIGAVGL